LRGKGAGTRMAGMGRGIVPPDRIFPVLLTAYCSFTYGIIVISKTLVNCSTEGENGETRATSLSVASIPNPP
jgi:hypothetical protein